MSEGISGSRGQTMMWGLREQAGEVSSILQAAAHIFELLLKLFDTKSCLSQVRREMISEREAEIQMNMAPPSFRHN